MTINNVAADGEIYLKSGNALTLTLDSSQNATFAGTIDSGAITSTGKITGTELEGTSLDINGLADITSAAGTAHLLTLHNTTNGSGASINFSDQTNGSQNGTIDFQHSDGSSQGGGATFILSSTEADMVLNVGGRIVTTAHSSNAEVDYGFVDDIDTGIMRSGANALRLVTGGTAALDITSSQNATFAGTIDSGAITSTGQITGTELEGTSLDINGDADISGVLSGGNVFPRGVYLGTTTTGFLIQTGITTNAYAMMHGTIKLEQFNSNSFQTIEFSATTQSNGTVGTKAGVANVAVTIKLFNYNSVWYVWVPTPSTYTTCTAYIGLANSYQGQAESFNEVIAVTNAAVPASGVTNSVDVVTLVKATTAYVDAKTWNWNDITTGTVPTFNQNTTGNAANVTGVVASANLDADTAHLSTTQTFTGAKTFTDTVALTGTGRITGIDTVLAGTDAASKTYVDAAITTAQEDTQSLSQSGNSILLEDGGSVDISSTTAVAANTAKNTNVSTDLTSTTHASQITINSDGNDLVIAEASGSVAGIMTVAHHDKLDGIETSATADQTKSDIDGLAITTVGTVDTGVWQGTAVASAYLDADTAHYSATRQVTHHMITDDIDSDVIYISLGEIDIESASNTAKHLPLIAPAAGKLLKILLRTSVDYSSETFTWKLYTRTISQSTGGGPSEIGAQSGAGPTNKTMVTYDFTTGLDSGTNAIVAGDKVQISIEAGDGATANGNYFITCVWEWDLS